MDIQLNLYILNILKKSFGEILTEPVIKSSISFCNYWSEFEDLIAQHKLTTNPDIKRLAQARGVDLFQKTRLLGFMNFLFFVVGAILFFFNWKISLIFFALIVLNYIYINSQKKKLIQNEINLFNSAMMSKKDDTERFIEIIKYYCTGGIQLISDRGNAFLPVLPETCITGSETFAHQKYNTEMEILEKYKNVKNVSGEFDFDFGFCDDNEYDPDLQELGEYLERMKKIGRIDLYDKFVNYNSR